MANYLRIEMKTKMPLDKKSAFTKKMGAELENLTKRQLLILLHTMNLKSVLLKIKKVVLMSYLNYTL